LDRRLGLARLIMIKNLTQIGNSLGLVIEKPILGSRT